MSSNKNLPFRRVAVFYRDTDKVLKGGNMNIVKKIRVINKILALVEEIEKIREAKQEQVKRILAGISELSPRIKKTIDDIKALLGIK